MLFSNKFKIIIFLIILVILLSHFQLITLYKDVFIKPYRKRFGLNKNICYKMIDEVSDILNKYKINFWLSEGTALGIYRDGDIISYDDDVDFSFRGDINNQYSTFVNFVIPELKNKGYLCGRIHNLYFAIKNNHFIDFDILFKGHVCVANNWRLSNEIFPFTDKPNKIQWRGKTWNIPTENYFVLLYGKTWRTPIKNFKPR